MSSTSATKDRHYAHLAARLAALSNNLEHTQFHLSQAADQAQYLRKLAINQGAFFMAALDQVDREGAAGDEQDTSVSRTQQRNSSSSA